MQINKDLFWFQDGDNSIQTYQQLVEFVASNGTVSLNYLGKDNSLLFANLLKALVHNLDFTFVDVDFSENELNSLFDGGYKEVKKETGKINNLDFEGLVKLVLESKSLITLFTSGTTGIPKKVNHSVQSLTRMVKFSSNHESDVWGFCYNPTHMAGLQVFFQAFLNKNPMIFIYGLDNNLIFERIAEFNVSHLSATPTFYRLFTSINKELPSVKRISIGGEKSDALLLKKIGDIFVKAKTTNIYASTELGSVLASKDDVFYITEVNRDFVKIDSQSLFIHKSLAAGFDWIGNDDWYDTGDLIEWVDFEKQSFRFVSRKSEMINTGGYKVNPGEIEDLVLKLEGVSSVYVYSKPNAVLGKIVVADIVKNESSNLSEVDIKKYLSDNLQSFKVPRIIKFVDNIQLTRTGKLSRN
jgi:acyl-coenzyme A synthetase/AMP-(fatty) acid ligase